MTKYSVYLVELDTPNGVAYYVGETGRDPDERFLQHKSGGRTSSTVVRRWGVRLRPDLTRFLGTFESREEAVEAETELGDWLRSKGYTVYGAQGYSFRLRGSG